MQKFTKNIVNLTNKLRKVCMNIMCIKLQNLDIKNKQLYNDLYFQGTSFLSLKTMFITSLICI